MIKFLVKGQNIETLEHEIIAADQVSFVNIHFVFDNSWKPLHKVVRFSQEEFTYDRVLGVDGTSCLLPAELTPGAVKMSLFGYDPTATETVRATTVIHTLHIRPSGFENDGGDPVPPTPDLYQQLLQKIDDATKGKSAFEIAVEHGYVGTEEEWLKSLHGKDGADGQDGAPGKDGIDGKDGEQGPPGENGADGAPGKDGRDGDTGPQGPPGKDGEPGPPGKDGAPGKDGEDGLPGRDGMDGKDGAPGKDGRDGVDGKDGAPGKDGKDGKDGITPDMSLYPLKTEVLPTLEDALHMDLQQFIDATTEDIHTLNEGLGNIKRTAHTHDNMEILNQITAQMLKNLQDFPDFTKFSTTAALLYLQSSVEQKLSDQQTQISEIAESVEPVISQAHWHHNLTLLNSITNARVAKWDKAGEIDISALVKLIEDLDTDFQKFRDETKEDQRIQDEDIINLATRVTLLESQIFGGGITLFEAGPDVLEEHDLDVCLMHNNGTYSLRKFVEQYPQFCARDTGYVLNYCYEALNWGAEVTTTIIKAVPIAQNSKIMMEYSSGATQNGSMYLVLNEGRDSHTPIADFIFNKIKGHDCIELSFSWLYSEGYIATLTSCSDVPPGEYFIAWVGISDNTHPKIKTVKLLKG